MNLQDEIKNKIINPNYIEEIKQFISGRKSWRTYGIVCESLSKLFLGVGTILSFSSGIYSNIWFSFMAGSSSTTSLILLQFSNFSYKESKKNTEELNILLKKCKCDIVPEVLSISMSKNMFNNTPENTPDNQSNY